MPEARLLRIEAYAADPAVPAAVMFTATPGGSGPHAHAFYELVNVRGGGGVNVIDGRPYPMVQGDLIIMQPGDAHRFQADPGNELRIVNVLFTPQLWPPSSWQELLALRGIAAILGPLRDEHEHKLALAPDDARQTLALCESLRDEAAARQDDWRVAARALITQLLLLIARARSAYGALPAHAQPPEDPIARALARLHADPRREVTVAELAREAGLTPAWFGERFKQQTGLSVRAFLTRLRLEEARRLLEQGASVTDAALSVGFGDPSYFARVFRRFAEISPRAYRRLGRID